MPDPDHIKAFRLFELVQRDNTGAGLQLAEWEREHLQSCEECRELEEFLRRQFSEGPHLHNNGDVSPVDGWYRNLCCDLDVYVLVGKRDSPIAEGIRTFLPHGNGLRTLPESNRPDQA